jgi:hypothetical protein
VINELLQERLEARAIDTDGVADYIVHRVYPGNEAYTYPLMVVVFPLFSHTACLSQCFVWPWLGRGEGLDFGTIGVTRTTDH